MTAVAATALIVNKHGPGSSGGGLWLSMFVLSLMAGVSAVRFGLSRRLSQLDVAAFVR